MGVGLVLAVVLATGTAGAGPISADSRVVFQSAGAGAQYRYRYVCPDYWDVLESVRELVPRAGVLEGVAPLDCIFELQGFTDDGRASSITMAGSARFRGAPEPGGVWPLLAGLLTLGAMRKDRREHRRKPRRLPVGRRWFPRRGLRGRLVPGGKG